MVSQGRRPGDGYCASLAGSTSPRAGPLDWVTLVLPTIFAASESFHLGRQRERQRAGDDHHPAACPLRRHAASKPTMATAAKV